MYYVVARVSHAQDYRDKQTPVLHSSGEVLIGMASDILPQEEHV